MEFWSMLATVPPCFAAKSFQHKADGYSMFLSVGVPFDRNVGILWREVQLSLSFGNGAQSIFFSQSLPQSNRLIHSNGVIQSLQKATDTLGFGLSFHFRSSFGILSLNFKQLGSGLFLFNIALDLAQLHLILGFLLLQSIDTIRRFLDNVIEDRCRTLVCAVVASHFQGMNLDTALFVESRLIVFVHLLCNLVEFSHESNKSSLGHELDETRASMIANVSGCIICEAEHFFQVDNLPKEASFQYQLNIITRAAIEFKGHVPG
mmetsp:Transcript_4613/g.10347  ORF Transcript_4613/g.10347 Transcript_4613/m.10347 type:complete len:262 (+) Transcript_4613:3193-3978(+)